MQPTTCFHDGVPHPILEETEVVLHDAVAFHSTNGVFNPHAAGRNSTIGLLFRRGEFSSRWSWLGLEDGQAREEKSLEAVLWIPTTARGQRLASELCQAVISGCPCTGVAQAAHVTGRVDHAEVCARGAWLLAPRRLWRLLWVVRTPEGACRPSMQHRAAGAAASRGGVIPMALHSSAVRDGRHAWPAQA
jgi:hypothetical protein